MGRERERGRCRAAVCVCVRVCSTTAQRPLTAASDATVFLRCQSSCSALAHVARVPLRLPLGTHAPACSPRFPAPPPFCTPMPHLLLSTRFFGTFNPILAPDCTTASCTLPPLRSCSYKNEKAEGAEPQYDEFAVDAIPPPHRAFIPPRLSIKSQSSCLRAHLSLSAWSPPRTGAALRSLSPSWGAHACSALHKPPSPPLCHLPPSLCTHVSLRCS